MRFFEKVRSVSKQQRVATTEEEEASPNREANENEEYQIEILEPKRPLDAHT